MMARRRKPAAKCCEHKGKGMFMMGIGLLIIAGMLYLGYGWMEIFGVLGVLAILKGLFVSMKK